MLVAMGAGALGVQAYPVDRSSVYLQLIELRSPTVFHVLAYGYATLWFTTPFFAASMLTSVATIVAYRYPQKARVRPLPAVRATGEACDPNAGAGRDAFRDGDGTRAGAVRG